MLQLARNRQTKTWTWAASSTVSQDIKAAGAITRIVLRINLTPSGSIAAALVPDGLFRIIQALTLKGSGGVSYFSMGAEQIGRMLHLLNQYDRTVRSVGHEPLSTVNDLVFVLHFGSRPQDEYGRDNPFDLSAFVPGFDDPQLTLDWLTTANNVMDGSVTISSATMYATVYEVLGTAAEIRAEMARQRVRQSMVAYSSYEQFAHAATISDLGKEFNVPTSGYLRRIAIMAQDDTSTRPLRADDEITEVGLVLPVGSQRLIKDDFVSLVLQQGMLQSGLVTNQATTGGALAVGPGFGVMDLRQHGDPDYGLDLRPYKSGDVKLGVTIGTYAAGDDSFYWYDCVKPYRF